jgi:hypothetical protein
MKLKKFDELNESVNNVIPSNKVWVVMSNGQTDISEIFLNKEDAEKQADIMNKEIYNYYRHVNKNMSDEEFDKMHNNMHLQYKVKSLYDALDMIKDTVYDDASDPGEEY